MTHWKLFYERHHKKLFVFYRDWRHVCEKSLYRLKMSIRQFLKSSHGFYRKQGTHYQCVCVLSKCHQFFYNHFYLHNFEDQLECILLDKRTKYHHDKFVTVFTKGQFVPCSQKCMFGENRVWSYADFEITGW